MFRSFHDYRLKYGLVNPQTSDTRQFQFAFIDFRKAIGKDPRWRRHFRPHEIRAIEEALKLNEKTIQKPRIKGFVWHHHEDHGVLQLVREDDHRKIHHYGGRFLTGGRYCSKRETPALGHQGAPVPGTDPALPRD